MEGAREPNYLPRVIPRCLRQLTQEPPISVLQERDLEAIQILRQHGRDSHISLHSITQACNLASGTSDVIVILLRPRTDKKHSPNQSFNDFVNDCATLKAVDELLRFATRGARNIGTVTVVNAFSLQPYEENVLADLKCEDILARFLKVKKPQVIIHCIKSGDRSKNSNYETTKCCCKSHWMSRFNFPDRHYSLESKIIEIVEGHTAIVIPSFHPSHAINRLENRLELRILLMYHFVLAFRSLSGTTAIPCCDKKILELCSSKRDSEDNASLSDWDLASRISNQLNKSYLHSETSIVPLSSAGFPTDSLWDTINRESDPFDYLSFWITLLLQKPQKFDLYGILHAEFLSPKADVDSRPLYARLSSALHGLVTERDHWFLNIKDTNIDDLEVRFSASTLHTDPQLSDVINANHEDIKSVQKTLRNIECDENVEYRVKTSDHSFDALSQDTPLTEYLGSSSRISVSAALRIKALSKRCRVINETLREQSRREWDKLPHTEVILYVQRLLECLRKLTMELEAVRE